MNKNQSLVLKLQLALMFVDCKVILLIVMIADLYRKTSFLAGMQHGNREAIAETLNWVWENAGSPYVWWIPIVIVADVFLKTLINGLTNV